MGFSQADSRVVRKDRAKAAQISFHDLSEEARLPFKSESKRERAHKRYEQRLRDVEAEVERIQPNMKAGEKYADVSSRLKSSENKLIEARGKSRDAEKKFEEVKQKRYECFMGMFDFVEQHIDGVYKALTKSAKHPFGGNAYLTLDDTTDPYNSGIKYNAMPPTKRFRDMDQLSGGEKTVAALALLFAIHSYQPSPFFVLDEIDAALDNTNVAKVSDYIRSRSGKNLQCVVISLKDQFFHKADALVGVYKDEDEGGTRSKTATLDLTPYQWVKKRKKSKSPAVVLSESQRKQQVE